MLFHFSWLDLIPLPFIFLGFRAGFWRRKIGDEIYNKEVCGYFAIGSGISLITDAIQHKTGMTVLDAGITAYWVYQWWNSGGGTGVKNFLQSLAPKTLVPVR